MVRQALRIHHIEPSSRVNGPGERAVIWVQGCALGCPGCFNPDTHAFDTGESWQVDQLARHILSLPGIEGLTVSGGEPAHQHRALTLLLNQIRAQSNLSVLVFSGYDWDELNRIHGMNAFLSNIDVLIAGRYKADQRVARGLVGSANKTIHYLTGRYTARDLEQVPQAEIKVSTNGEVIISGIDPLKWTS